MCDPRHATTTPAYRIDPVRDRLIALAKLGQWYQQRTGRRLHRSVTYRWRQRGVAGIKLPTIKLGGVRYTSEEAIAWWTAAVDGGNAAAAAARAAVTGSPTEDDATLRRAGIP